MSQSNVTQRKFPVWLAAPVVLALTALANPSAGEAQPRSGRLDGTVFTDPVDHKRLTEMWPADVKNRRILANERETAEWRKVSSRAEWEKFRDRRIAALRASLGESAVVRTNNAARPAATVTGTVAGTGYKIENIVFESRPGVLVTANLYAPTEPRQSMPGILICHSHHNPKTQSELQEMGALWAREGCLVLVMDQLGHGERRPHPFRTKEDYAGEFRPSRQDYYFRYNTGIQLHVLGESLVGWMAGDMVRGVDLLLGRPGIDPARIILLGAVAAGGDSAAVAAAIDSRIAASVPFNFGGPQPETIYPLPQDAEKSFNYFGGGSWESTRNLQLSARDGFAPWVIVGSVAPRKLVYAHEFAWDQEHDPVWRRLESIYAFYDEPKSLSSTHGAGSVRGSGPGNTHCNNIGPEHLVAIHEAFERWFKIPIPKRENLPQHSSNELTCLTPAVAATQPMQPLYKVAGEMGAKRAAAARTQLAKMPPADRQKALRNDWGRLLGSVEVNGEPKVGKTVEAEIRGLTPPARQAPIDVKVERMGLEVEPGIVVPLVLLTPAKGPAGKLPVVVGVAQHGKQAFLDQRAEAIAELLSTGVAVCLPDLRGTGEAKPNEGRSRNSSATDLSSADLMLGQTTLGSRVRDLRSVLRYLRSRPELDARRVALWGDSFAAANPGDKNLAVPLDAAEMPLSAEPLGGLAVLLTALFEDDVKAVWARGTLVSFQSLLDSPFVYVPHDVIVPGALTAGDLCDVAAALAPRRLLLADLVDGQNRLVTAADAAKALSPVKQAYEGPAKTRLSLPGDAAEPVAKWLSTALSE